MSEWIQTISESKELDWDKGNVDKNTVAHPIFCEEAEQVFLNRPLFFIDDPQHSQKESRIKAFGKTDGGKLQ